MKPLRIFAEKDSLVLFQDSVQVLSKQGRLHSDTLEPPSSLTGMVGVEPVDDPNTVTIHVAGTGKNFEVTDNQGRFHLSGLAGGRYMLILESRIPRYLQTTATITIAPRSNDTLGDTLRLSYGGIPIVSGIKLSQDIFSGTIRISWNKTQCADFKDYVIYGDACSAIELLPEPSHSSLDTCLIDSMFSNLYANPFDTVPRCLKYRVAVRTIARKVGLTNGYTEFQFMPKTYVWTYFTHDVRCEGKRFDSISIGDTFTYHVNAKNRTRPLRKLLFFDPEKGLITAPLEDTTKREIADSIRYAFPTIGNHKFYGIVLDSTGMEWDDLIWVKTVIDTLAVNAGNDTGVFVGEPVHLHADVYHLFGSIPFWRWKIGSSDFSRTRSDTVFKAPLTEQTIKCYIWVTDEDQTNRMDSMNVVTSLKVRSIASGDYHSLVLKTDGALWSFGRNDVGQLCDGNKEHRFLPFRVMTDVQSMAGGALHTLILKTDKTLWACGDNTGGQFGDGTTEGRLMPKRIMSDVQSIAAKGFFSLVLKTDASLWLCGRSLSGESDDSAVTDRGTPKLLMNGVQSMAAGIAHFMILKTDGSLWTCGSNSFGQLGDTTGAAQEYGSRQIPLQVMTGVQSIAAGDYHSLMVKTDGTLWGCGNNSYGQLGLGDLVFSTIQIEPIQLMSDVQSVSAGAYHTMILKKDGTLWACGRNDNGELGIGNFTNQRQPVKVMQSTASGYYHTLILKKDGTVWACGNGTYGQLGFGPNDKLREIPVRTIPYHFYPN